MWQFSIKNCPGQADQSELARASETDEGIHLFHYAIKKSPMPQNLKRIWITNLKDIKIYKKQAFRFGIVNPEATDGK